MKPRRNGGLLSLALLAVVILPQLAGAQSVSVDFRWTAPRSGGPVDHYNVYHIQDDGPAQLAGTEAATTFTLMAQRGIRHRIRVSGVGTDGREGLLSLASEELYIEIPQTGDEIPSLPLLRPNFPNPFNPETHIVYGIPATDGNGAAPLLEIYDLRGMLVRRLDIEDSPGWHTVSWDGTNEAGLASSSGQYVVRFRYQGRTDTWKMTMLK